MQPLFWKVLCTTLILESLYMCFFLFWIFFATLFPKKFSLLKHVSYGWDGAQNLLYMFVLPVILRSGSGWIESGKNAIFKCKIDANSFQIESAEGQSCCDANVSDQIRKVTSLNKQFTLSSVVSCITSLHYL